MEHPDTINAMGNLAAIYQHIGKYIEAEKLEIQVLDARNKIFGVEHPETIRAMENISVTYHNLGRYTEAEKLKIQVLNARNRILRVEHQDTTSAMGCQTATYQGLGQYTEVEKLDIQVLDATTPIVSEPWVMATSSNTALQENVTTVQEQMQHPKKRKQPHFVPSGKMPAAIHPDDRPLKKKYIFL